jgi:hypothetical protein
MFKIKYVSFKLKILIILIIQHTSAKTTQVLQ